MKTGKTLQQLAAEIERQRHRKKDYLTDTRNLAVNGAADVLFMKDNANMKMNDLFHEQVATKLGIPKRYYDRMRATNPQLVSANVNSWFGKEPKQNMIRTLNGTARAFVSDRYRPLDNFDLLTHALPIFQSKGLEMRSCELTERKLYMKSILPGMTREIQGSKRGDVIAMGIVVSNSEVGCGSLSVMPFCEILACTNGMVLNQSGMRKYHTGGRKGIGDGNVTEFLSNETKEAEDKALWLRLRDTLQGILTDDFADKVQRKFVESTDVTINSPQKAVELVVDKFSFTCDEADGLMTHLIEGGDLSAWGMSNAVTRLSQDVETYERATEFEQIGNSVIELPQKFWNVA